MHADLECDGLQQKSRRRGAAGSDLPDAEKNVTFCVVKQTAMKASLPARLTDLQKIEGLISGPGMTPDNANCVYCALIKLTH